MPTLEPVKVFISYSHKDERFREQLQEHLYAAKRQGLIDDWHDRRIAPGEEWENLINENLETSEIILLLVSSSFIASPYSYDKEMQRALEKHEAGHARVIPIILRPVDWSEAPFARLQALPRNGRAVSKWTNRDEAWMDVAKGIRAAVKQLRSERPPNTPELADEEEEEEEFASQHREVLDNGPATPWEYVDFELNIDEGSEPRKYPISARSMRREARAEMRFPFDEWQLKDKLRDLEVALLRSGGTRRGLGTAEEQTVQEFGQALFDALFAGDIRVQYEASLHEARRQGKGLRLKLHVLPPELSTLPWEFIYEPDSDYLVLSSTTPLVRHLDVPQPAEQLAVSPPFRILGMVASPQGLPSLDVEHEKRLMEEAVKQLRAEGLVELRWLEGQSWRDVQRAMRSGPWHIFHFVGHGGFDPATEEGAIVLSDEEGRKDMLRARSLARLLDDHFPLRLVFLNSCEGAKGSERDAFSSIAATLVRYGVPAVVAMQYEISDTAAIEFSRNFYEAVADGLPVDAAATEARTAVSMKSALEWGTPVLYMRSGDGLIFDLPSKARDTKPAEATEEAEDQESLLRRYREGVVSAWAGGELDRAQAEQLRDLANELGLNSNTAAGIEREVMGETIEAILDRQERASREKERKDRLDQLYARARRSHQNQEWKAVVDTFAEIHAEDPAYPDAAGLLASAREALEMAQKKEDALRQYREGVVSAWAGGELDRAQAEQLRDLANELGLNSNTAADIEREVMGETIEETLDRHEQAAREEERRNYLDGLYRRARGLHRDQEWQGVVDIFAEIHAENRAYPDTEGLLQSARNALEMARKEQVAIRRYREAVEWAWADEFLNRREVKRLGDLVNRLELSSNTAAGIEHEVMGETKEAILERWEQASAEQYRTAVEEAWKDNELSNAEAKWLSTLASELGLTTDTAADIEREVIDDTIPAILQRQRHLDELYDQARELHQAQEWQSVVDVFERIHSVDTNYSDSGGLLASAHEAIEAARKEEESLRQYREVVEAAWADGVLDSREVESLRDLADKLNISSSHTAEIERTVTGDTKEAILESQERAAKERYRNMVEDAWADNHVSDADAEQLGALARELDLSMDTVVDIERDVMGDTREAILERQEQVARQKEQLDELYARARRSHQDQDWQSVVDLFEQISAENPNYADPEGLLASAREALDHMRKVADLYDQASRYVDGSEWQWALECLEEVQRLEPGYQDSEELLSRVRQELEPPPTAKIPDLSGQEVAQANSALTNKGLRLGTEREASSDTVPEGQIIEQSLEANTEVEIGSSVSVTVSSGPSTVAVPDLVGKGHAEAESVLRAAGLELGKIVKVSSDDLPEGQVVQQLPLTGSKAERGTYVRVTVAQRRVEEPITEKPTKRPLSSRPDYLPEEPEPRPPAKPFDLPD